MGKLEENYEIDKLDRQILQKLMEDSRKSFQEIARELIVSGGTIHVRINKLKEAGIIKGSKLLVDFSKLGYSVCTFIGVNLVSAKDYPQVFKKLKKFPEVVEVHYTTGNYTLFIKVMAKSTQDLHLFLIEKLQTIEQIQSTETFISLDTPLMRDVNLA